MKCFMRICLLFSLLLMTTSCSSYRATYIEYDPRSFYSETLAEGATADIQLQTVRVYASGFHSFIGLPPKTPGTIEDEWAYAERLWFFDEDDGAVKKFVDEGKVRVSAAFKSLFWPGAGIVEHVASAEPYPRRYPDEKVRIWEFALPVEGVERMRAWFLESRAESVPFYVDDASSYFVAAHKYHVFYTCTQYIAQALREGGVNIWVWPCLMPQGLWMQLNTKADTRTTVAKTSER